MPGMRLKCPFTHLFTLSYDCFVILASGVLSENPVPFLVTVATACCKTKNVMQHNVFTSNFKTLHTR